MKRLLPAFFIVAVVGCGQVGKDAAKIASVAKLDAKLDTKTPEKKVEAPPAPKQAEVAPEDKSPTISAVSDTIIDDYKNEVKGDGKYKGKWVAIKGWVVKVGRENNPGGKTQAYIQCKIARFYDFDLKCFFRPEDEAALAKYSANQEFNLVGYGQGKIGTSVMFSRCFIQEK